MKSIEQIDQQNETKSLISSFTNLIGLAKLAKKVNFKRKSSISLSMIISWLMSVHFARHSLYRANKDDNFSIRTARNVLNDGRINWQKLLCLVAAKLISILKPVIDKRRRLAFIVDDTLMSRAFSKKTELLAKVYDHDKHEFLTGYRGLTLGWSDGNTFLPVNFALMSTKKKSNLIGSKPITTDERSIAGRRRLQAKRQMNDVTVELINQALKSGVPAKYVLFDSWFTSPRMFWLLKQLGLDGLGMIKKSSKVYYSYRHRLYDIKGLYDHLAASKICKKNHYLYSSVVIAQYQGHEFPLKVVFVSKRGSKSNYLVLATTKIALTPQQIIQMYGRRWEIETYFKTAKQYLGLNKSQIQSYDGQCGYIACTAITYDLLAWQERQNTDDKTMGDLFFIMNESLPEMKFIDALVYLITELKQIESDTKDEINEVLTNFMVNLPTLIQKLIKPIV
ncbi:transposase [Lactobacillus kalixensis]|nr:transposase [Lactobacillus kalixensis]MBS4872758.1 transposase [Peptoniphilus sp. oral taxon 375]